MKNIIERELIGHSAGFRSVLDRVNRVAPATCAVLIQGETGTGKELVARAVHCRSLRAAGPFISLNCSAVPAGLLESELFGHERGAFTGAFTPRVGRFQMAHKGTLFLDEIGDLPLDLQPKLLRALQEQEFERLGSSQTTRVDVRIIAATNQELGQMVRERRFRADLYYRLNVFPIALPPLRERKDDIPALVKHFVQEFASRMNRIIEEIPDQVIDLLRHYSWPGNIRELQNFVERGVLMSDDGVFRPDLSELTRISPEIASNERVHTLAEVERVYIAETLQRTNGVIGGARGAAAKLGIPRTTLISRMHKLGLSRDRAESAGFPSLPPHSAKCVGNLRITNGDSGGHPRVM